MTRRSLRLRLLLASSASILVALILAGLVLVELFERHVERRVDAELATYVRQLAGNIEYQADGDFVITAELADPRLAEPFSGLYWWIRETETGHALRSRSLWDFVVSQSSGKPDSRGIRTFRISGPDHSRLIVRERTIEYNTAAGPRHLSISAATNAITVTDATKEFAADMVLPFAMLGVFLCLAAAAQVWFGLRPLEAVRHAVNEVRTGRYKRLSGEYPVEIMPLVGEVNTLLDLQERTIEQSLNRAADLAHVLKTPLTVMMTDTRKLRNEGQMEIAGELETMINKMRGYIDRELSRARLASRNARLQSTTDIAKVIRAVIGTLQRTPDGEKLEWETDLPETFSVPIDDGDFSELIGNILDNAAKWAVSKVVVGLTSSDDACFLTVLDDGPGVPAEKLRELRQRGVRLDEKKPGSGMGLAIADDIVTAYDGRLTFQGQTNSGLKVLIELPNARASAV